MSEFIPLIQNHDYLGLLGTIDRDFFLSTGGTADGTVWQDELPEAVFLASNGDDIIESYGKNNWFYGERGNDTITTYNKDGLNVLVGGSGNDKITARGKTSYIVTSDPVNPMTIKYDPHPKEHDDIVIDLNNSDKYTRHYVFDFKHGRDQLTIKGQDIKKDLVNIQYGLSKLSFRTAILSFKNGAKVLLNVAEQQTKNFSDFMGDVKETMSYSFQKWENKVATLRNYTTKMGALVSQAVPTKLSLTDDMGDKHQLKLISSPTLSMR